MHSCTKANHTLQLGTLVQGHAVVVTVSVLLRSLLLPLPFFFSTSPPLPLRLGSGSLRPCHHHKPVRLPFWTSSFSLKPPVVATDVASLRPLLLLQVVRLCCLLSAARCAECFRCTVCSVFLFFLFFATSLPLPLRLGSGSLRPCRHRGPVRPPFWLIARFVDGLAPSACMVRHPYGSTMRSSTMSCVYSTHHFLRALNSFSSLLQRITLALSSLLLRAHPGPFLLLSAPPELFFHSCDFLAHPEHSLLLALPEHSHLLAPLALSSLPLAPLALSSTPLAPLALSSAPPAPPALSSRASCALLCSCRASCALFSFSSFISSSFCSKTGGFSLVSSSCPVSCLVSFSFSCSLSSSSLRCSSPSRLLLFSFAVKSLDAFACLAYFAPVLCFAVALPAAAPSVLARLVAIAFALAAAFAFSLLQPPISFHASICLRVQHPLPLFPKVRTSNFPSFVRLHCHFLLTRTPHKISYCLHVREVETSWASSLPIPVFIAKLSGLKYCWRVLEDFHCQECIHFLDIHNCLFMRLHFSIGGDDCRRTTRFRQSIHFSITQVLFADHVH